jgi:activator of HSP90 ATPase
MSNQEKSTGLTRDAGYQIGVRRTVQVPHERVWNFVFSTPGLNIWLGPTAGIEFEPKRTYRLGDGAIGEVRVFKPGSHARLTWQPGNYPRSSTIQVRIIKREDKTTIAFHQERLPSSDERSLRRDHFKKAIDEIERLLTI